MDSEYTVFPDYVSGSVLEYENLLKNGFNHHVPSPDLSLMDAPFAQSASVSSNRDASCSLNGDFGFRDPALDYITQILMEENVEITPWEDKDEVALRETELSLYRVLEAQCSHPADQTQLFSDQIAEFSGTILSGSSNEIGSNLHLTPGVSSRTHNLSVPPTTSLLQVPLSSKTHFPSSSSRFTSNLSLEPTPSLGSMGGDLNAQNMFSDEESILQFKRGVEEASKFLPKIGLDGNYFSAIVKAGIPNPISKEDSHERKQPADRSRCRKTQDREERDLDEERSTKQSAVSVQVSELYELFDKILLFKSKPAEDEAVKCGKTRPKGQARKKETIDLCNLLTLCAQTLSSDYAIANVLLKSIRETASPVGDGSQRLAHYFANGLEARMNGSGTRIPNYYCSIASTKVPAADVLRAYDAMLSALPYELPITFANKSICKMAEKAKALHIVDFGISFGFQWPSLIELLSERDGGPPKLRITGIELPQRGLRPAEGVEETGRLLTQFCERFNVPFEYSGIALNNWESLCLEDLKIDRNEMLAVNNLYRFETLHNEGGTAEMECPRNAVLGIIRTMKPHIFVHSVVNGSFNGPFFLPRFKEALMYYSFIFDVHDTTLSREEPARRVVEEEFFGRGIMNVVACEGSERNYRPESYKQWQVRNIKAGFKQISLDKELMRTLGEKLKTKYFQKDSVIQEDGDWMLKIWKGKILYAWSCWVPS